MSEPFLAEIRIVGFNFAPRGWAQCDGQILPINQNQSLYSLLGTTYGGDGRTSFALPDMRSRTSIHVGNDHNQGQKGGSETVPLTTAQIPAHGHTSQVSTTDATATAPAGNVLARVRERAYATYNSATQVQMADLSSVGGIGHENMQPYLALNFCIALQGLFPSRN